MTTLAPTFFALGDWTLDINWLTLIVGVGLIKLLAFIVIVVPLLLLLWNYFHSSQEPGTASTGTPKGARIDDQLGLVYDAAPDDADDLKEISGVAGVLEGKLHNFGVYTFRQVALWSDAMATEFGERLAFADRVFRDQWREQCAELHRKKYGSDPA
jgi:predicted flap endonuclease-1-like 5' DNA nuclease